MPTLGVSPWHRYKKSPIPAGKAGVSGIWWQQALVFLLVGLAAACTTSGSPATPEATGEPAEITKNTAPGKPAETPKNTATRPTATPTKEPPADPLDQIGETTFIVEVAENLEARTRGLSGRASLPPGGGMLFIFEDTRIHTFWMKGMMFPLDLVWIGEQCTVENITPNAPPPAPEQTDSDLPRFRSPQPVRYVLEINAGEAAANIQVGDSVAFAGSLKDRFGC